MMSFTRRLLALSAVSAFLFGIAACDDDSSDTPSNNNTNNNTNNTTCAVPNSCIDANNACSAAGIVTPCSNGLVCSGGQCVQGGGQQQDDDFCVADACNAQGKLQKCIIPGNMKGAVVDCDAGYTCPLGSAACVPSNGCEPGCSADGKSKIVCTNGNQSIVACGANETCSNGNCVTNGSTTPTPATGDLLVGAPCSCTGDDCYITITGKELNDVIKIDLGDKKLADTDSVKAPNFFSKSITGCEKLAAAVPAGMVVGCLRDETINFPPKIAQVATADTVKQMLGNIKIGSLDLSKFVGLLPMIGIDLDKIFAKLTPIFTDGIKFGSKNGYCIAATIDIDMELGSMLSSMVGDTKPLLSKITVGDHSVAKNAQCPAGSERLSYYVGKDISNIDLTALGMGSIGVGKFDVGFDMCLKSCTSNADCRESEGYSCEEIPTGNPAADYAVPEQCNDESYDDKVKFPVKKVCFDKATKDYFDKMTKDFEEVMPKNDLMCGFMKK